jgi:hypothetical protein
MKDGNPRILNYEIAFFQHFHNAKELKHVWSLIDHLLLAGSAPNATISKPFRRELICIKFNKGRFAIQTCVDTHTTIKADVLAHTLQPSVHSTRIDIVIVTTEFTHKVIL